MSEPKGLKILICHLPYVWALHQIFNRHDGASAGEALGHIYVFCIAPTSRITHGTGCGMLWRRRQRPCVNPALSLNPWFVYPMGGSLQGILLSREEHGGPHELSPIMLSQQEKPCLPSSPATAAEMRGSESPLSSFQASAENPSIHEGSCWLHSCFPNTNGSEQGRDLELPGASLGAKLIKSIGPGPNPV